MNIENIPILNPNTLIKFVDPLPIPQLLRPQLLRPNHFCNSHIPPKPFYHISMEEGFHILHSQIPATKLWTYNKASSSLLIENERGIDIYVKWENKLPTVHLLASDIDHNLLGAGTDVPDVRNVVHVHGGEQTAQSDGGPLEWFVPGKSVVYHYPNGQLPTMLFWHDHAMGITRLNNYAGLAGGIYIIRDPHIERDLNLPVGEFEIPLVLIDKTFDINGQIVYQGGNHTWMSHFLGNTILVNNRVWPFLNVKPTKYRLRIVNASDTRTYGLKLLKTPLNGTPPNYTGSIPGPLFTQIGSDGGYLPEPILLTDSVIMGIGERIDVIVDFSMSEPGEYILINNANGTFPNGSTPDANTSQVMKFNVINSTNPLPNFFTKTPQNLFEPLHVQSVTVKRQLILNTFPIIGTATPEALFLNNTSFMNPVTETPKLDSTELWTFVNTTQGMHPIHIHLIQFQLFERQQFRLKDYQNDLDAQNPGLEAGGGIPLQLDVTPYLIGSPTFPQGTNEYAWKDVIQVPGSNDAKIGYITRILARFAPQQKGQRFPFDATKGQYMWHCHIQSHEDNEMMRPYQIFHPSPGLSPDKHFHHDDEYCADYVIVGSGAAGALIANKLSKGNCHSVIVLEAGSNHDTDSLISDSFNANILPVNYISQYFWTNGPTIPQPDVYDNTLDYTGGRLLGGSTSINGMQYVRGTKDLFKNWENILQDKDYSPENITRLYTEFENYMGPSTTVRGKCGLMDIRISPETNITPAMATKFVQAVTNVTGYPEIIDYNDNNTPIGPFIRWQLYQHPDGSRSSSSVAFLEPIVKNSCNRHILCGNCTHKNLTVL